MLKLRHLIIKQGQTEVQNQFLTMAISEKMSLFAL